MSGHGHSSGLPKQLLWVIYAIILAAVIEFFPQNNININLAGEDKVTANNSGDISTESYEVVKVVDGDTIDILSGEQKVRVRLIGVDTPETVDPRKTVECFGKEASAYTKSAVGGEKVRLEKDTTQGEADKYGRLLAYVYLPNGEMLNRKLIAGGYAYEYPYNSPYKYQKEFKQLQDFAKREGRGLWAADACAQ